MVTALVLLAHVASAVTFCVDESENVAVAVNCCVLATRIVTDAGVTVIKVMCFTVKAPVLLVSPCKAAVICVDPVVVVAVAKPDAEIVATLGLEDLQVAVELTFAVVPSE